MSPRLVGGRDGGRARRRALVVKQKMGGAYIIAAVYRCVLACWLENTSRPCCWNHCSFAACCYSSAECTSNTSLHKNQCHMISTSCLADFTTLLTSCWRAMASKDQLLYLSLETTEKKQRWWGRHNDCIIYIVPGSLHIDWLSSDTESRPNWNYTIVWFIQW